MGNIFSSCIPKKRRPEAHRLGAREDYNNNTTSNRSSTNRRVGKTQSFGGHGKNTGSSGVSGDNNGGQPSREDIAAAAQKRQDMLKSKGIPKGSKGRGLSEKLEEQKKNPNQADLLPSNSNLQWRVD